MRVHAGPKVVASAVLPSKARMVLGSGSAVICPSRFSRGDHGIRLGNRTCFRMAGGSHRPFVIQAPRGTIMGICNARFGIRTCTSSGAVATALIRKDVTVTCRGGGDG